MDVYLNKYYNIHYTLNGDELADDFSGTFIDR